jgi:hypothetical protein
VILHFGDWHAEPPLVSQVHSERVLTYRVPLLLRGKLGRTPQGSNSTSSEFPQGVKSADGGRSGSGAKRTFRRYAGFMTFACGPNEIIALRLWIVATVRRTKVAAIPRQSQCSVLARSLLSARRGVRGQNRMPCLKGRPERRASIKADVRRHPWIHEFTPYDARVEIGPTLRDALHHRPARMTGSQTPG